RQIYTYPVPFFYSLFLKDVCHFCYTIIQFIVRYMLSGFSRIIWFKNNSSFISSFSKVPVYTVFSNIYFSIQKPFYICLLHIKLHYLIPFLIPCKILICNFIPKFTWFTYGFIIVLKILFQTFYLIVTHSLVVLY